MGSPAWGWWSDLLTSLCWRSNVLTRVLCYSWMHLSLKLRLLLSELAALPCKTDKHSTLTWRHVYCQYFPVWFIIVIFLLADWINLGTWRNKPSLTHSHLSKSHHCWVAVVWSAIMICFFVSPPKSNTCKCESSAKKIEFSDVHVACRWKFGRALHSNLSINASLVLKAHASDEQVFEFESGCLAFCNHSDDMLEPYVEHATGRVHTYRNRASAHNPMSELLCIRSSTLPSTLEIQACKLHVPLSRLCCLDSSCWQLWNQPPVLRMSERLLLSDRASGRWYWMLKVHYSWCARLNLILIASNWSWSSQITIIQHEFRVSVTGVCQLPCWKGNIDVNWIRIAAWCFKGLGDPDRPRSNVQSKFHIYRSS